MTSIETILTEPITTPEELRDFFNNGAIYNIADKLASVTDGKTEEGFSIHDANGEFVVQFLLQQKRRILAVRNSLTRLPGLFLNVPVELEDYKVTHGDIIASYSPRLINAHRPEHFLKRGVHPAIGNPEAAVKVYKIAEQELLSASGIVSVEDI